jgi:glycosyltransferase involved in cell wall biosynthesis
MRILYYHQYFTLPSGSAGTRSYEFAKRLIAKGHAVKIVCAYHAGAGFRARNRVNRFYSTDTIEGIEIIQIHAAYSNHDGLVKRSGIFLLTALVGIYFALKEKYDLIFATSTPLTIALPGIVAKTLRRKPFVFEVRDLWPELPAAMGVIRSRFLLGLLRILEISAYRCADGIIGLAPGIVEGIQKRLGDQNKPVVLIPNAADLELFQASAHTARKEFRAVFTGAHGIANGLDAVLDAAQVLLNRGRDDIHLDFIGDGKMKPTLQQRCQSEGLSNCHFTNPMAKEQLAITLGKADAGLMILANIPAFYRGTSPNKFFDYLAAGLPVVCNYPGWLAELINDNQCGIAVVPNSAEALADALERLADNHPLKAQMGSNARTLAESTFKRETLAGEFVQFLEARFRKS